MEQPKAEPEMKMESQTEDDPPRKLDQTDPKPADHAPNGDGRLGDSSSVVPGSESQAQDQSQSEEKVAQPEQSPTRASAVLKKSVRWSPDLVTETPSANHSCSSYVVPSPATSPSLSIKDSMENVKGVLGRWGRKMGEATRKAEELAGNTWQHLKTSPSFAEAAMGRIAQSTKVLAEGGYEKIFRQTFETVPEEQLQNSYACYLSTSAGPVMGILYVSTAKVAYCSDSPLSYKNGSQTEWSYYKVVIPLHQLKAVNPSSSRVNPSEKYVQVISLDNHEFWFMGFLNYEGAVQCLGDALQAGNETSA